MVRYSLHYVALQTQQRTMTWEQRHAVGGCQGPHSRFMPLPTMHSTRLIRSSCTARMATTFGAFASAQLSSLNGRRGPASPVSHKMAAQKRAQTRSYQPLCTSTLTSIHTTLEAFTQPETRLAMHSLHMYTVHRTVHLPPTPSTDSAARTPIVR